MGVRGNVCCVAVIVRDSVFSLAVLYVCVRDVMDVVFSVCNVRHGAVCARVSSSYGSCQCCILHDFPFFMLVEDARGDHMEEAYSRAGLMTIL